MVVRVLAYIDGSCVEYVKNISRSYPPPAVVFFAVGRLVACGRVRSCATMTTRSWNSAAMEGVECVRDVRGVLHTAR